MINYDTGEVSVWVSPLHNRSLKSILTIRSSKPANSGNYSCAPDNARPDWAAVRVIGGADRRPEGVEPAPVHSGALGPSCLAPLPLFQLLLLGRLIAKR